MGLSILIELVKSLISSFFNHLLTMNRDSQKEQKQKDNDEKDKLSSTECRMLIIIGESSVNKINDSNFRINRKSNNYSGKKSKDIDSLIERKFLEECFDDNNKSYYKISEKGRKRLKEIQ